MKAPNEGGPAFPGFEPDKETGKIPPDDAYRYFLPGMSLRDWFAGQALALGGEFFANFGSGGNNAQTISDAVYLIADAMLKARTKGAE